MYIHLYSQLYQKDFPDKDMIVPSPVESTENPSPKLKSGWLIQLKITEKKNNSEDQ